MKIHTRQLTAADEECMRSLLLRDDPNKWNYLKDDSVVNAQFRHIANGTAIAVLAAEEEGANALFRRKISVETRKVLRGVVSRRAGVRGRPRGQPRTCRPRPRIEAALVSRDSTGKETERLHSCVH